MPDPGATTPTGAIAILGLGEAGAAIAADLVRAGVEVHGSRHGFRGACIQKLPTEARIVIDSHRVDR